tara:strand:- start:11802 stop:12197 length:396 start_codon:yes stop_codon:yes gene_type:complete
MRWNDENTAEVLRLHKLGMTGVEISKRLGTSADSVRGRLRTLKDRKKKKNIPIEATKTEVTIVRKFGKQPRVSKNTYKVFQVRNLVTGVTYKVSGNKKELPYERLSSLHLGNKIEIFSARIGQELEFERLV